jgi:DNA-binding Lrp family transcriptional regulator
LQFVVIGRSLDTPNVPPSVQIALVKQTFQMFAAKKDPRIIANYPFAGERSGILVVDVKSGDELQELLGNLPFSGMVTQEIHAVGTVEAALKSLEVAEQRVASMTPAGVR